MLIWNLFEIILPFHSLYQCGNFIGSVCVLDLYSNYKSLFEQKKSNNRSIVFHVWWLFKCANVRCSIDVKIIAGITFLSAILVLAPDSPATRFTKFGSELAFFHLLPSQMLKIRKKILHLCRYEEFKLSLSQKACAM